MFSKFALCFLLAVYLQLDLRAYPRPSKTKLINEIRDLWNRGRGRDLTFFFFVYSPKIDISTSFVLLFFFLISKVDRVILLKKFMLSSDCKMIIPLKFDNLFPSLRTLC